VTCGCERSLGHPNQGELEPELQHGHARGSADVRSFSGSAKGADAAGVCGEEAIPKISIAQVTTALCAGPRARVLFTTRTGRPVEPRNQVRSFRRI
jgi:hypothetical protein